MNNSTEKATMVIVEDIPDTVELIEEIIQNEFSTDISIVGTAKSRDDAFNLIAQKSPDLAILDIVLEERENVFQLLESLREKNLKIPQSLILTAFPYGEFYASSINDYNGYIRKFIEKPLNLDAFIKGVRYILNMARVAKASQGTSNVHPSLVNIRSSSSTRIVKVPLNEFVYARTNGNSSGKLCIITDNFEQSFKNIPLDKFCEDNRSLPICQINKFEVVNCQKVWIYDNNFITLRCQGELKELKVSPKPDWKNVLEDKLRDIGFLD